MNKINTPALISGGVHSDHRGTLKFYNDFNMEPIKRLYISEHHDTNIVRAWQGHKIEQKWFKVFQGSFKMVVVRIDDWNNPSENLDYIEYTLDSNNNEVLHVPGGYVTGFQAKTPDSKIMVFSDVSLEESVNDDFRFNSSLWYKW